MKLPAAFRPYLRKLAQYAGPIGASTILRGCPCPAPVFHAPAPYTASMTVDNGFTLTSDPVSWQPYCEKFCGATATEPVPDCRVKVQTSEGNGQPVAIACDTVGNTIGGLTVAPAPWLELCKSTCGEEQDCLIGPDAENGNAVMIECVSWWLNCAGGRSTEGVTSVPKALNDADELGATLARMATLEAEAVPAFRRLAHELAALGAPRKLRRRAARSRKDEERHARTMSSLARRNQCIPAAIIEPPYALPLRSLEEVALENAMEGCIRETYGAWIALKQAREAPSAELRATMKRIAGDELRHAALAWEIHAWAMKRLDPVQKARITLAMHATWKELVTKHDDARELGVEVENAAKHAIGTTGNMGAPVAHVHATSGSARAT